MRYHTLARRGLLVAAVAIATALPTTAVAKSAKSPRKDQTTIYVTDLHCKKCVKKIARKLYAVPKVVKIHTNLKKDFVIVTPERGQKLAPGVLWDATVEAGFKPVKLIGPAGTFTKHPDAPKGS